MKDKKCEKLQNYLKGYIYIKADSKSFPFISLQINNFVVTQTIAVSLFMPVQNTSFKNYALKLE